MKKYTWYQISDPSRKCIAVKALLFNCTKSYLGTRNVYWSQACSPFLFETQNLDCKQSLSVPQNQSRNHKHQAASGEWVTCPFINSKTHIQGPKGSYQVNDHFDYTASNIIYCINCTLCKKTLHWRIRPQIRWPLSRTFTWCQKQRIRPVKTRDQTFQSPGPFTWTYGNLRN